MTKTKKTLFTIIYWVLQFTWGSILTIIGAFALVVTLVMGGKVHRNGCSIIVETRGNWGGLNLGAFSFCGEYSKVFPTVFDEVRTHEFGHSLQNMILGPLQILLVSIPSACRYWYYTIMTRKGKQFKDGWYDYAIFEYTASKYGYYWMRKLDDNFKLEYTYKRK